MAASDRQASDGDSDAEEESAGTVEQHDVTVDFTKALHTAGHEAEDLGFEGLTDSAPVLHDDDRDDTDVDRRIGADIATRGQDHH